MNAYNAILSDHEYVNHLKVERPQWAKGELMNSVQFSYNTKIAVRNYSIVLILLLLVTITEVSLGRPTEVLMLKLATVPLFFLSVGGLRAIYKKPIVESKLTLRSIEHAVLHGLLYSLFLFIVMWRSEASASELGMLFGIYFTIFTIMQLITLCINVKSISKVKYQ